MSSSGGGGGGTVEGDIGGKAATSTSDARIIRKEMRRILPHVPDLTLLRWLGGKVQDLILGSAPSSSSSRSNSRLGSRSDSGLSPELILDVMSKRIKLSQLTMTVAEKAATSSSKGMVISEFSDSLSKKRAFENESKGK
ncbi:hypothetical protein Acr_17g0007540 [Actinidia rufa]|uniref:Uncharacterized protein n=1 Tax=Actinidia rufa TaxID=165716 RepID=A0A7J0G333_9ERIC|nr:hypothetical protein Acr_17g0007540 [Actinidia rufa]